MNELRLFWQPGCTSCLAAKQFLASQGLIFDSINVREHPQAMHTLAQLGARSVPVVARGDQWVYAQERRDLAAFLGIEMQAPALPQPLLVCRIDALLLAAQRFTLELPDAVWEQTVAGRSDRTVIDIPFHIAQIVAAFLDACGGGELRFEYFERRPSAPERNAQDIAQRLRDVHARFSAWAAKSSQANTNTPKVLRTYYGSQPLAGVLERTAWHVAQHARQLEHLLVANAVMSASPLGDSELAGLPLPEGVWDAEIVGGAGG